MTAGLPQGRRGTICLALACLLNWACGGGEVGSQGSGVGASDPPAAPGSMAPNLALVDGGALLSWLEPREEGGHRLRVARWSADGWSAPGTVVEGDDFFANWADFPSVVAAADGSLLAHWLAKLGAGPYAYGAFLARSTDRGTTWQPLGLLHQDRSPTEHGFVAMVPEGGGVRAFWLDGREMTMDGGDGHGVHGAMALRTAWIGQETGPEEVLDPRVCECCQVSAAVAADGPLVVYRDRSESEVRDIFAVRRTASGWSAPRPVHADGWQIPGCPVNGPAVAARGKRVAVAWFTLAEQRARVRAAWSEDGGATFGQPIELDGGRPLGRVAVLLDDAGGAVVTWLEAEGDEAAILARRLSPAGQPGPAVRLAQTSGARASGFPRPALLDGRLLLAWVEAGRPPRLRFTALALSELPAAGPPSS